jgi:hypothetical protein
MMVWSSVIFLVKPPVFESEWSGPISMTKSELSMELATPSKETTYYLSVMALEWETAH